MNKERKFDLQDRLIDYAVRFINLSEALRQPKRIKANRMLELGYWI